MFSLKVAATNCMGMDEFVAMVFRLCDAEKFSELAEQLLEESENLPKNAEDLETLLYTLDPQKHTLAYMYVVQAKFKAATKPAEKEQLIPLFRHFIACCCAEQLHYSMGAYYELCHAFTDIIIKMPCRMVGIKVLSEAIDRICASPTELTSVHADLCQLSLKTFNFKTALKYLDVNITSILTSTEANPRNYPGPKRMNLASHYANMDSKSFLLYYYYGGMIYTAHKNYERALYFYEVCISVPAMATSQIMLEAYKKYILVSLILQARLIPVPKYAAATVNRFLKPFVQNYYDLVNAFNSDSSEQLQSTIAKHSESFTRDKNMSLISKVANALQKKNILKLTKAFRKLSLADVANRAGLANAEHAEQILFKMINHGEIFAKLDQIEHIVTFEDDPQNYNSPEMLLKIQNEIRQVNDIISHINLMENEIVTNPAYVKKVAGNMDDEALSSPSSHCKLACDIAE